MIEKKLQVLSIVHYQKFYLLLSIFHLTKLFNNVVTYGFLEKYILFIGKANENISKKEIIVLITCPVCLFIRI